MNEDKKTIEPGKNIFLLDGPIGRLQLLKTFAIIIGFGLLCGIANAIIILLFGRTKYTKILYYILALSYFIPSFYIIWLGYTKRLYDIIGAKNKAIFYTVIIFFIEMTLPYIPFLKLTGIILSITILGSLLLLPGKYILPKQKEKIEDKTDEEA